MFQWTLYVLLYLHFVVLVVELILKSTSRVNTGLLIIIHVREVPLTVDKGNLYSRTSVRQTWQNMHTLSAF